MDSRPPYVGKRRRHGEVLIGLAGVLVISVVAAGALMLALRPVSGRQPPGAAARHSPRPQRRLHPARPPVGKIGSYPVAARSMRFIDRSRPQLGARVLPTLVRYPVVPAQAVAAGKLARGPFPLVVFAPGYLQCRSSYSALLTSWASAGYVVAAVQFPRTHCHLSYPDEADLSNQPADLSTVITRLLAISGRSSGALSGLIDPARIAVAGHSDGGDTAVAVAANTCCRDHRVIAAVILAGAEWPPLGGQYFPPGTPPMLFVQGTDDTWNPPSASLQLYLADATGVRYYLELPGMGHFSPYEGRSEPEPVVARVTVDFLNRYLAGKRASLASDGNVPGVAVLASRGHLPG